LKALNRWLSGSERQPIRGGHVTETAFTCETCGAQYSPSPEPPESCRICSDERQYVRPDGQRWTTLAQLSADHRADIREEEPGLTGIGCEPSFGIGQRPLLIESPAGNVLWDCMALLDDEIVETVRACGRSTHPPARCRSRLGDAPR
jgi:hypothetical protein